jgi:hypothetical protein
VQEKGIRALGLLQNVLHPSNGLHDGVVEGVLGALKTHGTEYKIVSAVCSALRLFLSPRVGGCPDPANVVTCHAICVLRSHCCGDAVKKLLGDCSQATAKELFVDAAFVLGLVEDPVIALEQLEKSKPELHIVRAGLLQGLFELAKSFDHILQPYLERAIELVERVAEAADASEANEPSGVINESVADVGRAAELLLGYLRCPLRRLHTHGNKAV